MDYAFIVISVTVAVILLFFIWRNRLKEEQEKKKRIEKARIPKKQKARVVEVSDWSQELRR